MSDNVVKLNIPPKEFTSRHRGYIIKTKYNNETERWESTAVVHRKTSIQIRKTGARKQDAERVLKQELDRMDG